MVFSGFIFVLGWCCSVESAVLHIVVMCFPSKIAGLFESGKLRWSALILGSVELIVRSLLFPVMVCLGCCWLIVVIDIFFFFCHVVCTFSSQVGFFIYTPFLDDCISDYSNGTIQFIHTP